VLYSAGPVSGESGAWKFHIDRNFQMKSVRHNPVTAGVERNRFVLTVDGLVLFDFRLDT